MIIDKNNFTPRPLCHLGGTQIGTLPEQEIEPGHQWIAIENTPTGRGLTLIIGGDNTFIVGKWIISPHNADADRMLNDLVAACQEIKRLAPVPAQRALFVAPDEITEDPRD